MKSSASAALGRWQYLRGKSLFYIEAIRSWVAPSAAAGAFAKYLGVQSRWSIVIAIALPVVIEAAGFILGRFLYNHGGVEAEYRMAMERDPFKIAALKHAKDTHDEMRLVRLVLTALLRRLESQKPK